MSLEEKRVVGQQFGNTYGLNMPREEAKTLLRVLRDVAGHPETTHRRYIENISDELEKLLGFDSDAELDKFDTETRNMVTEDSSFCFIK